MKLKVFAIHDAKAEAYLQPFFMANKGSAIRAITDIVTKPDHQFAKYPEDFTLFELGEYDDSNGQMLPHLTPIPLAKAIELKTVHNPANIEGLKAVI